MKLILPLALAGALISGGTALAAGMGHESGKSGAQSSSIDTTQVKDVQSKLQQQGYDVGQVDGVMGPTTRQALIQFQGDKGLSTTGQIDGPTLAALDIGGGGQQGALPDEQPLSPGISPLDPPESGQR